jgi:hypothetical protein
MKHCRIRILEQASLLLLAGGAVIAQEDSRDLCPGYSYQRVTVGRGTETRIVRDWDAATPYVITERSYCKQPCAGDYQAFLTIGRRQELVWVRDVVVTPTTIAKETGSDVERPGDYWAMKSVGKGQVRVWMHDVPLTPPVDAVVVLPICSDCPLRTVIVGDHAERRASCVIEGRTVDCSKNPPECPDCATRAKRRIDEPEPR